MTFSATPKLRFINHYRSRYVSVYVCTHIHVCMYTHTCMYVFMIILDNLVSDVRKKIIFITSRIHPGETPSSYVCQGI